MTMIAGKFGAGLLKFLQLLRTGFCEHRGIERAATLTYTTLLSLVPLMTVALAVLAAFPVAERMSEVVQDFVFNNFVPASGEQVQIYLNRFVSNAARLTGTSFVVLILVAFLMMRNIDLALNAIWETHAKRRPLMQFLTYWALLSLGPILVVSSFAATSYLISLPLLVEADQTLGIGDHLIAVAPVATSALAFTLMYLVIPNRRVPVLDALAGGLLAALLFEVAKRAFAVYVTSFPSYEAIYGALAVIPIFLVWLYLTWIIFLLGAEFTHSLELFRHSGTAENRVRAGLPQLLQLLSIFHCAQQAGGDVAPDKIVQSGTTGIGRLSMEKLIGMLDKAKLITRTERRTWVLQQDLRQRTLYDLMKKTDMPLPATDETFHDEAIGARVTPLIQTAREGVREALDTSLDDLIG
ncbi:virulence factor BrkB family protein [Solemya elarraichensis gill symbiont]|uniref:UPF0761 membrane protein BOW52_04925 n=1 Tax=Solemya elarraichensis gill symbiont TaxID=1918949 RepID=A0A1T2L7X0_9GAMM|nr:virulence factor BrkB family protein [Solemya elarraichensis gill symbiont]OOZ41160.1 hypothetical protein BOW52_04925 [Solemya elarraichensis gill symbiont]